MQRSTWGKVTGREVSLEGLWDQEVMRSIARDKEAVPTRHLKTQRGGAQPLPPVTPDASSCSSLENPKFPGILARLEESPVCQRLPLTSFLILPFQRITRLKMLVEVPNGHGAGVGGGECCSACPLPGQGLCLPHWPDLPHQNILKRTAQGSEEEDMATKAFNALKEVSQQSPTGACSCLNFTPGQGRALEVGLGDGWGGWERGNGR